jgi:hypothetical protein
VSAEDGAERGVGEAAEGREIDNGAMVGHGSRRGWLQKAAINTLGVVPGARPSIVEGGGKEKEGSLDDRHRS